MATPTVTVDFAKDVFEVLTTGASAEKHRRLSRSQFEKFLASLPPDTEVVMEACGTAHHWGRRCHALGLVPVLLPTSYVRPYVRRNKTDRTDAEALFEARRCGGIWPVPVKTPDQQALQSLHRVRGQWQSTRIARMNVVRGLLREYGLPMRAGAVTLHRTVPGLLAPTAAGPLPALLRETLRTLVEEIRDVEARLKQLDQQLHAIADADPVAQRLQTVPGVGVLVATAMVGSVPHIHAFRRGRHFASWLGLTPREASSGLRIWRGGISKRGDVYLRALLTHGARSVLFNAHRRARVHPDRLSPIQRWVLAVADPPGLQQSRQCVG